MKSLQPQETAKQSLINYTDALNKKNQTNLVRIYKAETIHFYNITAGLIVEMTTALYVSACIWFGFVTFNVSQLRWS